MTSQLTSAKSMVSSLETQKAELNTKVTQLAEQPSQEQTRIVEAQAAQIKELQQKLNSAQDAGQQSAQLAQTQATQLQELTGKIQSLEQQSSASQKELAARNNELTAAKQEMAKPGQPDPAIRADLESQIASLKSEMSTLQIRHENQLKELSANQSPGSADSTTADSTTADSAAADPTTVDSSAAMRAEIRAQEKRIMELESENHEAREQLSGLAKLRAKLESQSATAKKAPTKRSAPKSKRSSAKPTKPKKPSSKKSRSSKSVRSSSKDDLTQIVGIGKVYQRKLNKIGISTFKQIAAWSKKDADEIEDKLGLGDRINNEKWVKQAKSLAKKKK